MRTRRTAEGEANAQEDLRCKRTDGSRWRCGESATPGRVLCEKHYNGNRLRRHRQIKRDNNEPDGNKPPVKRAKVEAPDGNKPPVKRAKVEASAKKQQQQKAEEIFSKSKVKVEEEEETKIFHTYNAEECQREVSDEDDEKPRVATLRRVCTRSYNDNETKDNVNGVPCITVDLQKLRCKSNVDEHFNLVLKLPRSAALNSFKRKTLALLLEKLTRKEFIKNVVAYKMQRRYKDPALSWKVLEGTPYVLGRTENPDMYASFLTYLCSLAEKDEGLLDDVLKVAEKGTSTQGDRVEYVFRTCPPNDESRISTTFEPDGSTYVCGYTRMLPLLNGGGKGRVSVHLTMSKFVKGKHSVKVMKGAALPIALLSTAGHFGVI